MSYRDGDVPETDREMYRAIDRSAKRERKTLLVKVEMVVEIDVDEYREAYGHEVLATIRSDVKHAVADTVATGGVIASGLVNSRLVNP